MGYRYVSQLSHVEITTPTPQQSLDFFTEVLGLLRHMDTRVSPAGEDIFTTLTSGAQNHDYALIAQTSGRP